MKQNRYTHWILFREAAHRFTLIRHIYVAIAYTYIVTLLTATCENLRDPKLTARYGFVGLTTAYI